MNIGEWTGLAGEMRALWPRMNLSDPVQEVWFEKIKRWTRDQVKTVMLEFLETDERNPAISFILPRLRSRFPSNDRTTERPFTMQPAYPLLEFIMDTLGVDRVTEEIRSIVGNARISDLLLKKGWQEAYRGCIENLALEARDRAGMSQSEFNRLLSEHQFGLKPSIKWKDRGAKAAAERRWSSTYNQNE